MKRYRVSYAVRPDGEPGFFEADDWKEFLFFIGNMSEKPLEVFIDGFMADSSQQARILSEAAFLIPFPRAKVA